MRRVSCPSCGNVNVVSDEEWAEVFACEGITRQGRACSVLLRNGKPVPADALPPPVDLPIPGPHKPVFLRHPAMGAASEGTSAPGPLPRLTGPHLCHVCKSDVHHAYGLRRGTVCHAVAPSDSPRQRQPCRMDVYAAIYHCPCCRELLETPSRYWELEVRCPACGEVFLAPRDDVLHETEGFAREGTPYEFHCSSCRALLRCDPLRNGAPLAGLWVVCLVCRNRITVPSAGYRVGHAPRV